MAPGSNDALLSEFAQDSHDDLPYRADGISQLLLPQRSDQVRALLALGG